MCYSVTTVQLFVCEINFWRNSFVNVRVIPPLPSPIVDTTMSCPTALQSYLDALILLWRTADPLASAADTLSPPRGVPEWHKKARIVVQVEALNLLGLLWHGRWPPCSAKLHYLQLILAVAAERRLHFHLCLCSRGWHLKACEVLRC